MRTSRGNSNRGRPHRGRNFVSRKRYTDRTDDRQKQWRSRENSSSSNDSPNDHSFVDKVSGKMTFIRDRVMTHDLQSLISLFEARGLESDRKGPRLSRQQRTYLNKINDYIPENMNVVYDPLMAEFKLSDNLIPERAMVYDKMIDNKIHDINDLVPLIGSEIDYILGLMKDDQRASAFSFNMFLFVIRILRYNKLLDIQLSKVELHHLVHCILDDCYPRIELIAPLANAIGHARRYSLDESGFGVVVLPTATKGVYHCLFGSNGCGVHMTENNVRLVCDLLDCRGIYYPNKKSNFCTSIELISNRMTGTVTVHLPKVDSEGKVLAPMHHWWDDSSRHTLNIEMSLFASTYINRLERFVCEGISRTLNAVRYAKDGVGSLAVDDNSSMPQSSHSDILSIDSYIVSKMPKKNVDFHYAKSLYLCAESIHKSGYACPELRVLVAKAIDLKVLMVRSYRNEPLWYQLKNFYESEESELHLTDVIKTEFGHVSNVPTKAIRLDFKLLCEVLPTIVDVIWQNPKIRSYGCRMFIKQDNWLLFDKNASPFGEDLVTVQPFKTYKVDAGTIDYEHIIGSVILCMPNGSGTFVEHVLGLEMFYNHGPRNFELTLRPYILSFDEHRIKTEALGPNSPKVDQIDLPTADPEEPLTNPVKRVVEDVHTPVSYAEVKVFLQDDVSIVAPEHLKDIKTLLDMLYLDNSSLFRAIADSKRSFVTSSSHPRNEYPLAFSLLTAILRFHEKVLGEPAREINKRTKERLFKQIKTFMSQTGNPDSLISLFNAGLGSVDRSIQPIPADSLEKFIKAKLV